MARAVLIRHPAFPSEAVQGVEVDVSRGANGTLDFRYTLTAHTNRLRTRPPCAPQRRDELWKNTCFEAFMSQGASGGYYEFNFSPSTEWALYSFNAYREGMASVIPVKKEWAPRISRHVWAQGLALEASVHSASLPLLPIEGSLKLALSAIIEEEGGELSYWALNHPSGHPDFHNAGSFILEL